MAQRGANKKLTTNEFIERACEVHGDRYDYSQVVYDGMHVPVTIVCPDHGAFSQKPVDHLGGCGCPRCAQARRGRKRLTTEEFVERSRAVHGDRYDYSKAVYVDKRTKVEIVCPEHGSFWQLPTNHWKGQGCPVCAGRAREFTTESFVERARKVHGDAYDYSQVEYKTMRTPVTIVCPEHGAFQQTPLAHLKGRGCPQCGAIRAARSSANDPVRLAHIADTCERKYGHACYLQSEEGKAKAVASSRKRFGADSFMASDERVRREPEMQKKRDKTREKNGTYITSQPEIDLGARLVERFGESDVKTQYKDSRYPWKCDFYICSRDLFIELNACQYHNGHWHDANDARDREVLDEFKNSSSKQDKTTVRVWSEFDVKKRERARAEKLNYVTFWAEDLSDASVWFALECPDGRDWERIWSWMPERELIVPQPAYNATTDRFCSMAARWAQQDVFYGREKALWADDRRGLFWDGRKLVMPERMRLLANRVKYADVPLTRLSDTALLRGFGISGRVLAYTVFNTKLVREVLERYGATSIADPCAGWGERAMLCAQLGLPYEGVDVNEALADGYDRMLSAFGDGRQTFQVDRGEVHAFVQADVMLTCPPYHDREIYSDAGAEHLGADAFAAWWRQVCENMVATAAPRLMVVQTNQACRDVFLAGMETAGYQLVEEPTFNVRASHRNRRVGGQTNKREFESVLVCERVDAVG